MYRVTLTYYLDVDEPLVAKLHTDGMATALRHNKPEVHDVSYELLETSERVTRVGVDIVDPPDHDEIEPRWKPGQEPKELPRGKD